MNLVSYRTLFLLASLAGPSPVVADILIKLVPRNEGPYWPDMPTIIPVFVWAQLDANGPQFARVRYARLDVSGSSAGLELTPELTHSGGKQGDIHFWQFNSAPRCESDELRCGEDHEIDDAVDSDNFLSITYWGRSPANQIILSQEAPTLLGSVVVIVPHVIGTYIFDLVFPYPGVIDSGAEFWLDSSLPDGPPIVLRANSNQIRGTPLTFLIHGAVDCKVYHPMDDCNHNGQADWCDLASPWTSDCNSNRIPDECEGAAAAIKILFSDPSTGCLDARQDRSRFSSAQQGPMQVRVGFDCLPTDAATGEELGPNTVFVSSTSAHVPTVQSVVKEDRLTYSIVFSEPIPPGAWTTIQLNIMNRSGIAIDPTANSITLGFLPGDVNANGHSSPSDFLDLIDHLNAVRIPPLHPRQCDLDRSGVCAPSDIVRLVDLLNGVNTTRPWLNVSLPPKP